MLWNYFSYAHQSRCCQQQLDMECRRTAVAAAVLDIDAGRYYDYSSSMRISLCILYTSLRAWSRESFVSLYIPTNFVSLWFIVSPCLCVSLSLSSCLFLSPFLSLLLSLSLLFLSYSLARSRRGQLQNETIHISVVLHTWTWTFEWATLGAKFKQGESI